MGTLLLWVGADVLRCYLFSCGSLHEESIKKKGFAEITLLFQPLRPVVFFSVMDQLRQVDQKADHLLPERSSQVEFRSNGVVDFFSNLFGKVEEGGTLSVGADDLKFGFCPRD